MESKSKKMVIDQGADINMMVDTLNFEKDPEVTKHLNNGESLSLSDPCRVNHAYFKSTKV